MNVRSKRCGCGAVFQLVRLTDRSTSCVACQRKLSSALNAGRATPTARDRTAYDRFASWPADKRGWASFELDGQTHVVRLAMFGDSVAVCTPLKPGLRVFAAATNIAAHSIGSGRSTLAPIEWDDQ